MSSVELGGILVNAPHKPRDGQRHVEKTADIRNETRGKEARLLLLNHGIDVVSVHHCNGHMPYMVHSTSDLDFERMKA